MWNVANAFISNKHRSILISLQLEINVTFYGHQKIHKERNGKLLQSYDTNTHIFYTYSAVYVDVLFIKKRLDFPFGWLIAQQIRLNVTHTCIHRYELQSYNKNTVSTDISPKYIIMEIRANGMRKDIVHFELKLFS